MKNFLILILLVFLQPIVAQNSAISLSKNFAVDFGSSFSNTPKIAFHELTPVEQNLEKDVKNLLLAQNIDLDKVVDSDDFSSLLLKAQMEELNRATPFEVTHNATTERFIRVYLKDRKEYLSRLAGKSIYYFPIFEQYLDAYDLPLELKYLAVVESALNPVAVSSSGAKGLWQFMFGTGQQYNLYINSYVDERYDPVKSTKAACAYLKDLYDTFGDWNLALAAYNSGPGNVRKAIKRAGGETNYWQIREFLPKETSSYVPAFYATMYLFSHAEYHGIKPLKGELHYFETDTVHLKRSLTFSDINKVAGINMEVLRSFNPVYKKDLIPALGNRAMSLTLPISSLQQFLDTEEALYSETTTNENKMTRSKVIPITEHNSYLVRQGDNLNSIAKKHHISLEQLKIWNGLETNFLISGQRLVVSDKKKSKPNTSRKNHLNGIETKSNFQEPNRYLYYTVEYGDTLFKISRKFGNIPITTLRTLNDLEDVNYLKPGTKLQIKKGP